jgi:hypothetical protein
MTGLRLNEALAQALEEARERAARETVRCPACNAAPGEPCTWEADVVHMSRLLVFDDLEEVH